MEIINLVYVGNLFRTTRGLEIINSFINLLSVNGNFKLTIYQKSPSKKAFLARITTFFIKSVALLKIRNIENVKIEECSSDNAYLSKIKKCDIGISLGSSEVDLKHCTRTNEYITQKLSILSYIKQLQGKNYSVEKTNNILKIQIKNNYSITDFESPYSFANILLNMNGKEVIEDKKNNSLKINCIFTDKFETLFNDQKIDDLYDVNYDFKLKSSKSSNSSIMNAHKNKDKKIDYILHKIKLYKNVIYCLKIKHEEKVSIKIFENENYQNPICRSTLTTKDIEHIYFKVPKTQSYELEVLTWGKSGINYDIFNYISPNNLCNDEVYVINLNYQKERYSQTDFLLNKNGIVSKRFEAIDGKSEKYDAIWNEYTERELTSFEKKLGRKALLSRGALGYLLSMEKLFTKAIRNKSEYICIIDDDIMTKREYRIEELTRSLVKLSNFNIMKMGSSQWNWDGIDIKKGYYEANKLSNGSFFNIYHKNTFKEIYDSIKKYDNPFDGLPLQTFINRKYYVLYPNYASAYLDDISTISNKKRSEDYLRFKWNKDDYDTRNNAINLINEDTKKYDNEKLHFLIGITTFKRYKYLEDCINSLIETLDDKYHFTIILSIGYEAKLNRTFYEKLFLKLKDIPNLNIAFYTNKLHYVYYNSNIILKHAENNNFDFGFIINDDIVVKKNWFLKYYKASRETKYDHLCYCINNNETVYLDKLKTNGDVLKSNGVLLTFTKKIIEKIGFFDEENFKVRGQAHHDWSRRCCRMNFNNNKTFYDISDSNNYVKLNEQEYESTILSYDSLDKIMNFVDVYELKRRNRLIEDSKRIYIDSIVDLNLQKFEKDKS